MVVDGVVASVHSTLAGSLETLPFRFVDWMYRGSLQSKPIAAALAVVLESPALRESFQDKDLHCSRHTLTPQCIHRHRLLVSSAPLRQHELLV